MAEFSSKYFLLRFAGAWRWLTHAAIRWTVDPQCS